MIDEFGSRTAMMLGEDGYLRLCGARVAVFGVGGVGGYAVEALARAGIGALDLVDSDVVSESNINRQIIATRATVGMYKTEAAKNRILDINPACKVTCHNIFFSEEVANNFDFSSYDYIVDAIDSTKQKVELIALAHKSRVKIISAMGAGNKLDPTRFKVADISKTTVCPLAKATRTQLRHKGINHTKVVFSDEPPVMVLTENSTSSNMHSECAECSIDATSQKAQGSEQEKYTKRRAPGSVSFVPSVMGLILAGEVIKEIAGR